MVLKKQTARGSLWNLVRTFTGNAIDFIVYALLARVLSIEEFALLIFCLLIIEFANIFTNVGISQNLIQRETWDPSFSSSTFVFTCLLSLGIALVVASVGSGIAFFMHSAQAMHVILALSIIPLVVGLQSVLKAKLEREFRQARITMASAVATIVSGGIAIVMILQGVGLWALVFQKIFQNLLLLVLLSKHAQFIPSLTLKRIHIQELMIFCLPLMWVALLDYVYRKSNNFYAALVLGANAFALISIAKKGQEVLAQSTMAPISNMIIPAISRVDYAHKTRAFYNVVELSSFIVIPCFLGLGALAGPFVEIAFGDAFVTSAHLLTITTSAIVGQMLVWFLPNLLVSIAHTKSALHIKLLDVICSLVVGGIFIFHGLQAMLIALTITGYILVPIKIRMVKRYLPIDFWQMLKLILPATTAALIMIAGIYGLNGYMDSFTFATPVKLILSILFGALVYFVSLFIFFRQKTIEKLKSIFDIFKK